VSFVSPVALAVSDALIAAGIAAVVSLATLWVGGLREAFDRRRGSYAQALAASVAYREFPYAIRRRRHDAPGEERVRLSEALREIQRELAFHSAWIRLEGSAAAAEAYGALVRETRRVAGGYMQDAWKAPPAKSDSDMNIAGIDYGSLEPLERSYLDEVAKDPSWWRFWRR
jgi:hypothetical protein